MLTIGNVALPFPFMVAPMAGVSDLPFRLVSRTFGAPLAFTEMIDARALSHRDKRTGHMLSSSPDDRPLGVQLVGNDENYLLRALDILEGYEFDILDFNAACPAPKVTRKGMGAALLKEPKRLEELLGFLVARSRVPVTVKIRAGWDKDSLNAREVALRAQDAGAGAVFIHGRTKTQGYSGAVDYGIIRDAKEALRIPVIASGDNITLSSVRRMLEETGCDGVAIARGSLGNPWLFREMICFLEGGGPFKRPDAREIVRVIKEHLDLVVLHYGERKGVSSFRKFIIWYTRGLPGSKPFRDRAFRAEKREDLLGVVEEIAHLPGSLRAWEGAIG
jgi:tRNA-dihydrouridine synthase B